MNYFSVAWYRSIPSNLQHEQRISTLTTVCKVEKSSYLSAMIGRTVRYFMSTVDQLMFAAINVRVLVNHSISPAINVRDLVSQ